MPETEYTPMTLSGMAVAVVPPAPVAASTPHHGSASNFATKDNIEMSLCLRLHTYDVKTLGRLRGLKHPQASEPNIKQLLTQGCLAVSD